MSQDHDASALLRKTAFFRGLSPDSLELVARTTSRRSYAKGQRIFEQGAECPGVFCVVSGLVRLYKLAPSGKDHVLHFAEPGSVFAEVAVVAGFPAPATAEAVQDTNCLLVPARDLRQLLESNHALCLQLLDGMAFWVRQLVGLLEDVVLRDASGRVARHLVESEPEPRGEFFQLRMLKRDLASHLNLTSETLSRTLRRLGEAGLIELGKGQSIRICRRDALSEVARGLLPAEFE